MREILFRGKRTDNGEWVEGGFLPAGGKFPDVMYEIGGDGGYEVNHITVGQYTGVPDKNGRQMAEGDIVEGLYLFGMRVLGVVSFRNGAFGLSWYRGDILEFSAFSTICNVEYEVIGNICDNPDLFGGAEDDGNR